MKKMRWLLSGVVSIIVLAFACRSEAATVTVLTDSRVMQYRAALDAAKQDLPQAAVLEVGSADLDAQLSHVASSQGVVLAIGQKAMLRAQQAGVAVVFCMVLNPSVSSGKPITGLRLEVAAEAQLDSFKRIHPAAKRIGVIYNAATWSSYMAEATQAAAAQGLRIVGKAVTDGREITAAIRELGANIDVLWLWPDPQLISVEVFNLLLITTLERKIALFGFLEGFTRAGALASVTPDYTTIGHQAARLAADLAAKPPEARLPFPKIISSPGVLSINARTAQELGVEISDEVLRKTTKVFR